MVVEGATGRIVEIQSLKDTRAWIAHAMTTGRASASTPPLCGKRRNERRRHISKRLGYVGVACEFRFRTRSCILTFQAFINPQCSGKIQLFEMVHSISSRSRSKASDRYPLRSTGCGTAANCRASFDYVRAASQMSNESAHIVV
jgi:hypothetical protein